MSELFDLFPDDASSTPADVPPPPVPMTDAQRLEIRRLFAQLGVVTAREQFDLVNVLIGIRLASVADLDMKAAALLKSRLEQRIASKSRVTTGNSWTDRDEDTWIDKL
ncbi:hypothetical protein PQI51_10990 [Microbacterium esteraromaticum]|uniref:hypothetical protein n=1 Tax=Microbacterium esteraromaticum TaxID=57043 RepID=UPI0030B536CC